MTKNILLAVGLLIALAPGARGQSGRTLLREGNDQYSEKQYSDAEVSYRKALESVDDVNTGRFNLGDALYEQGRYDEAVGQYENVLASTKDAEIRAKAYHNIGNSNLKGNKLEASIAAYKEALKLNPEDEDTRYNLEYAKRLLRQQQQQQQQQEKKDQNKDDKEKQDKKDQKDQKQEQQKDEEPKKDREQDRQQQDQKQDQDKQDQQRQPQQRKDQISKADAERILEALKKQEQDVKKKLQKQVPVRVKTDRDW